MKSYRVFSFDSASRIVASDAVEANSDAEALSKAARTGEGVRREVWDRERLVGRIG